MIDYLRMLNIQNSPCFCLDVASPAKFDTLVWIAVFIACEPMRPAVTTDGGCVFTHLVIIICQECNTNYSMN